MKQFILPVCDNKVDDIQLTSFANSLLSSRRIPKCGVANVANNYQ